MRGDDDDDDEDDNNNIYINRKIENDFHNGTSFYDFYECKF